MTFCRHHRMTMPRQDELGGYRRCLDCATRLPFHLFDDLVPPRRTQERAPQLPNGIERTLDRNFCKSVGVVPFPSSDGDDAA